MMSIRRILLAFLIFILLDASWLYTTSNWFHNQIIDVQRVVMKMNMIATALCYLILFAGLYWFILRTHRSPIEAGILGIFVYAVYELTNKATFKKWKWSTVVADTAWGGVLFTLTTWATYTFL